MKSKNHHCELCKEGVGKNHFKVYNVKTHKGLVSTFEGYICLNCWKEAKLNKEMN